MTRRLRSQFNLNSNRASTIFLGKIFFMDELYPVVYKMLSKRILFVDAFVWHHLTQSINKTVERAARALRPRRNSSYNKQAKVGTLLGPRHC